MSCWLSSDCATTNGSNGTWKVVRDQLASTLKTSVVLSEYDALPNPKRSSPWLWKLFATNVVVSNATGSRRMSVTCRENDPKRPRRPSLVLKLSAWPCVPKLPPNADASAWNPPAGILVDTLTTAVFLLPYSASQPPVLELI